MSFVGKEVYSERSVGTHLPLLGNSLILHNVWIFAPN